MQLLKLRLKRIGGCLGQVKALVEGYPIVAPADAQPRQEIPEDLKDAVEKLEPHTQEKSMTSF